MSLLKLTRREFTLFQKSIFCPKIHLEKGSDFLLLQKRSNLIPLIYTKKGMIFYFFNFWTKICQFVQCAGASKPTLMYVVPTSSTYQKWEHGKNGSWGSSSWEVKVKATSATVASQFSLSLNSTTLYLVNIFRSRARVFTFFFVYYRFVWILEFCTLSDHRGHKLVNCSRHFCFCFLHGWICPSKASIIFA